MKPDLVDQPTKRPTNKLMISALVAPAVTEAWGAIMADVYAPLAGAEVSMLVGSVAALVVGYFVRDRANT